MKVKQVINSNSDITILVQNLIRQICFTFVAGIFYPILIWYFFGEGSNAFMYTSVNEAIYVLLLIGPTAIYNIIHCYNNVSEKKFGAAKSYLITEIVLLICLSILDIYYFVTTSR